MSDAIPPLVGPNGEKEKFFLWRLGDTKEIQYFPVWMWVPIASSTMTGTIRHWLKYDEVSYETHRINLPVGTYYCLAAPPRGLDPTKLHWDKVGGQ